MGCADYDNYMEQAKTNKLICDGCDNKIQKGDDITVVTRNGVFYGVYCLDCDQGERQNEIAIHELALDNAFGVSQW